MVRKYSPAEQAVIKNPGMGKGYRPLNHSHCVNCGHPMRPNKATKDKHPGTLKHLGRGYCSRCYSTWQRYRFPKEAYDRMLIDQCGKCAARSVPMTGSREPVVDHDHETGRVRGLLCVGCNVAEGMLQGDPARARALADYMEEHSNVNVY